MVLVRIESSGLILDDVGAVRCPGDSGCRWDDSLEVVSINAGGKLISFAASLAMSQCVSELSSCWSLLYIYQFGLCEERPFDDSTVDHKV